MYPGLSTRTGTQLREGGLVSTIFVVSTGPVYAAKAQSNGSVNPNSACKGLSLIKDVTTGFLKLTVAGGAKNGIRVLSVAHCNKATPTDATTFLSIELYDSIDEANGVLKFKCINRANPQAFADPAIGDEVHVTLYVAR